jgi:putative membrane protein
MGRRHQTLQGKMTLLANIAVAAIALLHVYILVLEMFLWTSPRGRRAFGLSAEFAQSTKALAANQGLYNGFLAAGLVWGLVHPDFWVGVQIQAFFLICVAIAGVYGALTAKLQILFIQTFPAILALGLLGGSLYFNFAQVAPAV